jgi:zinc protease
MGFLKDIQDMPNQYDYSKKFFDRYYRPEYTTIVVAGDVKPKTARVLVDKYWGAWKQGSYVPEIPQEPPQEGPRTNRVDWPTPTLPIIEIGFKVPAYTDSAPDTAALDAFSFLAFSPNSELYQKLVVEEQKVDVLQGFSPSNIDAALFEVGVRVKKEADLEYVRDQILATIQTFQEKPVDAQELDAVRKHLRYSVALRMDSSDAIAATIARYIALRRTPETMNKLYEQYAKLTPEDVQKAARSLVEKSRTIVTLVGRPAAAAAGAGGAR